MNAPTPDFTAEPGSLEDSPLVHAFFDKATSTWTYIVVDPATKEAVVIDTVLEYDPVSGKVGTTSVQGLAAFLKQNGYEVTRIIETHVHADHATGALALKQVRHQWHYEDPQLIAFLVTSQCPAHLYRPQSQSSSGVIRLHLWVGAGPVSAEF